MNTIAKAALSLVEVERGVDERFCFPVTYEEAGRARWLGAAERLKVKLSALALHTAAYRPGSGRAT